MNTSRATSFAVSYARVLQTPRGAVRLIGRHELAERPPWPGDAGEENSGPDRPISSGQSDRDSGCGD